MDGPKKAIKKGQRAKFLSGSRLTKFQTNVKKIASAKMKNTILKGILRYNRQSMSGNKDILFAKVAHGMTFGRIPKCENCQNGRPFFNLANGKYKCNGYHDDGDYIECNKTWTHEQMKPQLLEWTMKSGHPDQGETEDVELESVTTVSAGETVFEDMTDDEKDSDADSDDSSNYSDSD